MDTKKRNVLIAVISACILLFSAYFIIKNLPDTDVDDDTPEDDAYLYVDQNDTDKIVAFSFKGGEFDLSFEKRDGIWIYSKNTTLPVDQPRVSTCLSKLELILATKLIDPHAEKDSLSQYGLEKPSYTLTADLGSEKKIYLFGDTIESKGLCYIMEGGTDDVFLAEIGYIDAFSLEIDELLTFDTLYTFSASDVKEVELTFGDVSAKLSGTSRDIPIFSELAKLSLSEFVDFGSDRYGIYGLGDESAINVRLTLSDKMISYRFGLGESDEFIYLNVESTPGSGNFSEMIYLLSAGDIPCLSEQLREIRK